MAVAEAVHETFALDSNGTRLNVHRWSPSTGDVKARLLVVHGYAEHAARYREFALNLAPAGIELVAPDLRGHGHSEGARGFVSSFDEYLDDAESAFNTLPEDAPRFILGHSNGGLIALDYVSQRSPALRGLVLTNPYLELEMKVPVAKAMLGKLAARVAPRLAVPSGIDPQVVSRDPQIVAAYERDPLVFTTATVGFVRSHEKTAQRVKTLEAISVSLLYIHSRSDPLVSSSANAALASQIACPDKTVWIRPDDRHEVLNELNRTQLHREIAEWILSRSG